MERYRIGIVGAGFGVKAHLPALLAHPRFEVVALASPSSAAKVAKERDVAHAFRSCQEMLAGCELDAVTVASPPFAHTSDVLACLDAEKHVLCEKPFTTTLGDAEIMVAAESNAGTACGVSHEFRFVPQAQALHELVVNHHLDPLRTIEITQYRRFLRLHDRRPRGWWFERERGGGIAGALLSHLIDHANWLAGRSPKHSVGHLRTANLQRTDDKGTFASNADDGAYAILDYGAGLVARLAADGTTAVESYTCAIHGEHRTAVASGKNIVDLTLFSIDDEETNELECKPSRYARFASINGNVPPLMELYDQFVDKIEGRPNTLPTFDEALATQEVLAAIGYASSKVAEN
jgi:predicted dehydrogenase